MKIFAIDTSSKYLSLAIAENDKIIVGFHRDLDRKQCERLIPEIDKLLKKAKLKLKDIDCIAFSKGPGAFTALRIGGATVKGLALAAKIKIVGIPTLDVLAYRIGDTLGTLSRLAPEPSLIVPIIDARRRNVYASIYSFKNGCLHRYLKYSVLPITELLKQIKADAVFLGDGIIPYRSAIEDDFKFKAEFAPEEYWYPHAAIVAKIGYELIKNKRFEDADKFVPMYLYPKDVQVAKRNLR